MVKRIRRSWVACWLRMLVELVTHDLVAPGYLLDLVPWVRESYCRRRYCTSCYPDWQPNVLVLTTHLTYLRAEY